MPQDLSDLVQVFISLISLLIPLVIALTLLSFFWGLTKFIAKTDDANQEEGKKFIIWGLVGLFVMLSLWGILRFVYGDFGFGRPFGIPVLPTR